MAEQKTINRVNGIEMDTLQSTIVKIKQEPELGKCKFRASNKWLGGTSNGTTINGFYAAKREIPHKKPFTLYSDEPPILAGEDKNAGPVEHLLHALAACVTTSMVAYAAINGIHIEELESTLEGDIDLNGFLGFSQNVPKGYSNIRINFKVKCDTNDMEKLKNLAKFSPVYNTLVNGTKVAIEVEPK